MLKFVASPTDEHMRILKLHYVFSFILILFLGLNEPVYAQSKSKIQKGSATWYGSGYHGRKTTSGEVYNKNHLTAAHPSLPFGTKVKVTNSLSRKSVIVRINDRGPFKGGHIIDLSEAAARKIDLFNKGFSKVTVEVLTASIAYEESNSTENLAVNSDSTEHLINTAYFVVQAGSFSNQENAQLQSEKLKHLHQNLPVSLCEEVVQGKKIHRVEAGRFSSRLEAEAFKADLKKKGIPVMVKQMLVAS